MMSAFIPLQLVRSSDHAVPALFLIVIEYAEIGSFLVLGAIHYITRFPVNESIEVVGARG